MIDERELIKTLLQWKENGNKFAGLKEDALIDKVIEEITIMSIRTRQKEWRFTVRLTGTNSFQARIIR